MTDTKPRREYVAAVASVGKDKKGVGWALALAPRQGMQYPDTIYGKPETEALVKDLKPGQRYTFVLERDNLKKNRTEGSANPFDYFETLIEVRPAPAAEVVASVTTPQQAGVITQLSTRASEFRTPEQMIRGVALEQATALAVALIAKTGERLRTVDTLVIASKYERYITTGDIPKLPEPPLTPKAQADRDFEELLGPGETLSGKPPASPSPSGGATIPPVSAQAPTAAAGTLLPAARQPGPFKAIARDGKPLESSTAMHAGGAPETTGGQRSEPETPTFRNWGDVAGEIMKLPGNKGKNSGVVARAVWDEVERRFEGVTVGSWMDVGLTTKTPADAFALAWHIAVAQSQAKQEQAK